MKAKIDFKKAEWVFCVNNTPVTVRWDYKGKAQLGSQNCKQYKVSCIIYNDSSGLLNRICDTSYITFLQPNYGNSYDYLMRIIQAQ